MFRKKKKKWNDESKRNLLIFNWRVRFTVEDLRYSQVRQIYLHEIYVYRNPFPSKSYDRG